jgi:hypothetical protein
MIHEKYKADTEYAFCHADIQPEDMPVKERCVGTFFKRTLFKKTDGTLEPIEIEVYECDKCGEMRSEDELINIAVKVYYNWKSYCAIDVNEGRDTADWEFDMRYQGDY